MSRPPPEGVSVRRAGEADLPGLARLDGGRDAYAVLDLCRAAGTLWAALEGDAPQGFAAATELDGTLHLEALAVAPSRRGRGLGSALLEAVVEHGRWAFHPALTAVAGRESPLGRFLLGRGFLAMRSEALPPGLAAKLRGGQAGLVALARRL